VTRPEWPFYSPSQVDTFISCPRKWWFKYVAGYKAPPKKGQIEGKRIHAEIETSLRHGVLSSDDRAVAALAELAAIDAAGGGSLEDRLKIAIASPSHVAEVMSVESGIGTVLIESEINIPIKGKPEMYGLVDLADFRKRRPEITDWKTTSDLKYALTEYEIAASNQMLIYAKWALDVADDVDSCIVRHIVIPTVGRARAIATEAEVSRDHVESKWSGLMPILDEVEDARMKKSVTEVEARGMTNGECNRYGGCEHLNRCTAAMFRREEVEMTSDIKARIAELKKAIGPAAEAGERAKEAADQGTIREPSSDAIAAKLAKLRAVKSNGKAQETISQPQKADEPETSDDVAESPLDKVRALKEQARVASAKQEVKEKAVEAVKGKPTPSMSEPSESGIGTLYLDCAPLSSNPKTAGVLHHITLEEWVAPATKAVREKSGIGWQYHDYRKGTAMLCDEVDALEAPESLVVDTSTPLAKVLIEVLIPRADRVIKGFR
jgi:hypothetical protein